MKVKHFNIRLNKENLYQDEDALNSFMQGVSVNKTATQHINSEQPGFWSILVFYDDLRNVEAQLPPSAGKNPSFDPLMLNVLPFASLAIA